MNYVGYNLLRYRALGLSVIPTKTYAFGSLVAPGADKDAKKPLIRWEPFQERIATVEELTQWNTRWPNAGIAVVTGAVSDAVVLDDDRAKLPPLAGRTAEEEARFQELGKYFGGVERLPELYRMSDDLHAQLKQMPTARAKSGGGGYHFWLRMPRNDDGVLLHLASATHFLPGWDIRADGGYIIVPPSVHPSGTAYAWDGEDRTPEGGIIAMPRWVYETVLRLPAAVRSDAPAWEINHNVFEGFRNDALTSWFGGHMRGAVFYREETWPMLLEIAKLYNEKYFHPPVPPDEIEASWASVCRMERARRGAAGIAPDAEPVAISSGALATMRIEPLGYAVNGLFVDGTSIVFGKPKSGKTYLMLQTSIAVANGTPLFPPTAAMYAHANHPQGFGTTRGDVLHLALEDSERRLQDRMTELIGNPQSHAWPQNIEFYLDWPNCYDGGLVRIERWLDCHPRARTVVIDIAARFMNAEAKRGSLFRSEYHLLRPVVDLAKARKIPIIIVDHATKDKGKMGSGDPFDSGAGTLGSQAAVDSSMLLAHAEKGPFARLWHKGRDIERGFIDLEHSVTQKGWRLRTIFDEVSEARMQKKANSG